MSNSKPQVSKFKNVGSWIIEVIKWAAYGIRTALPYMILIGVLYCVSFYTIADCKEKEIRLVGLCFQIIGFLLVAWQLINLSRLFSKPSALNQFVDFWRNFPTPYIRDVSISAHITSGAPTMEARLSVKAGPNTTLERRVEIIEDELRVVTDDLMRTRKSLNTHKSDNKQALKKIEEETRTSVEKVEKLMDDAVVGGIHWEWIGTLYFVIGVGLATAAPEMSVLLGYERQCS